jgi:hypothetical protein
LYYFGPRTELGFVPYADPGAYGGGDGAAEGEDEGEDGESGRPFFAWEGSLGMAFWALPPLYQHAWTTLIPLLRVPRPQQQQVMSSCACVRLVRDGSHGLNHAHSSRIGISR